MLCEVMIEIVLQTLLFLRQFIFDCFQFYTYISDIIKTFINKMNLPVTIKPDLSRKNTTSNWATFVKKNQNTPTGNNDTKILDVKIKQAIDKDLSVNKKVGIDLKSDKQRRKRNVVKENFMNNVSSIEEKNVFSNQLNTVVMQKQCKQYSYRTKSRQIIPVPVSHLVLNDADFLNQPNLIGSKGIRPIFDRSPCVAIDCEMVGVKDGTVNILARVSLVNLHGKCIYDTFVKAEEPVVDYRTSVSGVRPNDMEDGADFNIVRSVVATLIHKRILIGHALSNDLSVLGIKFPHSRIRDTSRCKLLRSLVGGGTPSLKKLCYEILRINIQDGEHSSVEDARATMKLYLKFRKEWEETYIRK